MNTPPQVDGLLGYLSGPLPSDEGTSGPFRHSGTAGEYTIEDSSGRIPRPLHRRLSSDQRNALTASFAAGARQKDLALQYGVGIRSVKRLVRTAREEGAITARPRSI
ncbi:hypothetical protein [Glycomyces arizonensis]|uniref:hypothetical protein n=1 Tax=Glycomyces arizonensis TaxID=256035 RepID=UPI0012EC329D|nr:hypothetical protein [Glycomyces arizonensis]